MIASEGEPRFPGIDLRSARRRALQRTRRQRIAARNLAAIEAGLEPALALFRRAMGEGVGHDVALHLFLQPVVADRGCGLQRLVDIAGSRKLCFCWRDWPRPRRAVGLQLDAHLELFASTLLAAACCACVTCGRCRARSARDGRPRGDHIGLRELAGGTVRAGAEFLLHIVEERGVEIDALIARQ